MVAKFREKCAMAEKTLQWLIKTTKSRKPIQLVVNELKDAPALESTQNVNTIDENIELVECVADTIDDHPHYMIIENDDTTAESDDATDLVDDGKIETSHVVEESAEVSVASQHIRIAPWLPILILMIAKQELIQGVDEYGSAKTQIYIDSTSKAVINHSCDYCGAGFAQANNLLRHMQSHEHVEDISQWILILFLFHFGY